LGTRWHHARFVALADDREDPAAPGGGDVVALGRGRLAKAQPRAVEQGQHRGVARQNPGLALLAGAQASVSDALGGRDREGLGQRPCQLRRSYRRQRADLAFAVAFEKAGERARAREHTHQRAAADAVGPPRRHERAHVERLEARERRQRYPLAEMAAEEDEELANITLISLNRFW